MNFNPRKSPLIMPERSWYYGYPFVLGLMVLVAAGLFFFFEKKESVLFFFVMVQVDLVAPAFTKLGIPSVDYHCI